jgi:hypothetical protein
MKTENADEFCKMMGQALGALSVFAKEENYDGTTGETFLKAFFNGDRELFWQFVGFVKEEIKASRIPKSVIVNILIDIVTAGVSIGWADGYNDAKRIYSPA